MIDDQKIWVTDSFYLIYIGDADNNNVYKLSNSHGNYIGKIRVPLSTCPIQSALNSIHAPLPF